VVEELLDVVDAGLAEQLGTARSDAFHVLNRAVEMDERGGEVAGAGAIWRRCLLLGLEFPFRNGGSRGDSSSRRVAG
jgi:hypothetical protein